MSNSLSLSLVACVTAYLVGSVPCAILVSKLLKLRDPRTYGSKNVGAANVMRGGSWIAAGLTLLGDMLKGVGIVAAVRVLVETRLIEPISIYAAGVLVVLGHAYPVFFRFRGGKGVATALGVVAGFDWIAAVVALAVYFLSLYLTRYSSLSILLSIPFSFAVYAFRNGIDYVAWMMLLLNCFLIFKLRQNIVSLLRGTERTVDSNHKIAQ